MFKHCKEENLSYWQHFCQAMRYYFKIQKAALCVLIHAFFPCLFEKTASKTITNLAIHFFLKSNKKNVNAQKPR